MDAFAADCEIGGPLEKRYLLPFEPEEGAF